MAALSVSRSFIFSFFMSTLARLKERELLAFCVSLEDFVVQPSSLLLPNGAELSLPFREGMREEERIKMQSFRVLFVDETLNSWGKKMRGHRIPPRNELASTSIRLGNIVIWGQWVRDNLNEFTKGRRVTLDVFF